MTFFVTSAMMIRPHSLRIHVTGVPAAAIIFMVAAGAHAQDTVSGAGPERAVSVVPRVSFAETLTDNVRLSSTGQQAEQITEVSPGIRVTMNGARVKGFFDYALTGATYTQNSSPNRTQHALTTSGTWEAVDNWAFLDFSGSISQQTVSAFGTQSIGNTAINANRAEVSTYRISPYVRGRLGDLASYQARYSHTVTDSDATRASGVTSANGMAVISGDSAFRNLGWSADASWQRTDFSAGRSTEVDRLNLGLSYAITSQLKVFANTGRESNNYASLDKQSYNTSSIGVNWLPSDMSSVSATRGRRSFGNTHSLSFEHRTPRTAWRFSDTKDVSVTPNQMVLGSLGSIYDLLFSQFASIEPNEAARAQLVTAYLQTYGISPNAAVIGSFLTSALSLQRRQDLSFALLGARDTITFIATRSESNRLDILSGGIDDFSSSAVVQQRGFSVNYAHRLTPDYSLGILVSQQNTAGTLAFQDATLRFLSVSLVGRVGKQATVSVAVRRVVSSGNSPYIENAITGNLILQF